jgi:hypothetical protein
MRALIFGWVAALALGLAPSLASAETLTLKADLLPIAGTNSKANGTLAADYDTASKKLTWSGTYKGLGTYATGGGFHGAPGSGSGYVKLPAFDSPFEGTAILSDKQGDELIAGRWFIVLRTSAFPKGELRGQLTRN